MTAAFWHMEMSAASAIFMSGKVKRKRREMRTVKPVKNAGFTRRRVLQITSGGVAATLAGLPFPLQAAAQPIRLRAAKATQSLVGDDYPATAVWAFNGTVPGTELRVKQGDELRVRAENALDEATTVH